MKPEKRICLWCKKSFVTERSHKKYCNPVCMSRLLKIRQRIYSIFQFENEKAEKEIQRLERLGCNYTFPKPHQNLNLFYELKGENENE